MSTDHEVEKKLLKTLTNMVEHHDTFFEEDIARYVLKRLGADNVQNSLVKLYGIDMEKAQTNLWGLINAHCVSALLSPPELMAPNAHQSEAQVQREYQSAMNRFNQLSSVREKWFNLLSDLSPDLIRKPDIVLKNYGKDPFTITLNGWVALTTGTGWAKVYLNNQEEWKLNPLEEQLVAMDLLRPHSKYSVYSMEGEEP